MDQVREDTAVSIEPAVRATLDQVNIVVSDMERSVAFYRLLGADVSDLPAPWGAHHRVITRTSGETTAELDSAASARNWAAGWEPGRTGVVIGFRVGSDAEVDASVQALASAGHRILQPPHDTFFGARYAVIEDPDGITVGIMGPIDDTRRWMPELPA